MLDMFGRPGGRIGKCFLYQYSPKTMTDEDDRSLDAIFKLSISLHLGHECLSMLLNPVCGSVTIKRRSAGIVIEC